MHCGPPGARSGPSVHLPSTGRQEYNAGAQQVLWNCLHGQVGFPVKAPLPRTRPLLAGRGARESDSRICGSHRHSKWPPRPPYTGRQEGLHFGSRSQPTRRTRITRLPGPCSAPRLRPTRAESCVYETEAKTQQSGQVLLRTVLCPTHTIQGVLDRAYFPGETQCEPSLSGRLRRSPLRNETAIKRFGPRVIRGCGVPDDSQQQLHTQRLRPATVLNSRAQVGGKKGVGHGR